MLLSSITRVRKPCIPTDLSPIRNELKAIQDILTLERSDPITQIGQIDSLGGSVAPGVVGGIVDMNAKGRTLRNEVVNGNFADGLTGWNNTQFAYGTLSVSNNIITNTSDGTQDVQSIYQEHSTVLNDKYFLYGRIKTSTENPLDLKLKLTPAEYIIPSPQSGEWHEIYSFFTGDGTTQSVVFQANYSSPQAGNELQVDGNTGVFVINMTVLGIEDYTEEQMLALVRSGYFEGTQSAGPKRLKTVGKNLIKGESEQNNQLFNRGGGIWTYLNVWENGKLKVTNGSNSVHGLGVKLKTKIGEAYTIKCQAQDADDAIARVIVGDNTGTGVRYGNYYPNTEVSFTFVADANEIIIRFIRAGLSNPDKPAYFWDIQLEKGLVATAREPYKQSLAYTPEVGKSLPNGMADEVSINEGVKTKNVEEYILQGVDIDALYTGFTNVDRVRFSKPTNGIGYNAAVQKWTRIEGMAEKYILAQDDLSNIGYYTTSIDTSNYIYYYVAKGTYADLAAAQADLTGLVVHYQLAEPETIQLNIPPQSLLSFENGTLLQEHVVGEVTFYGANCPASDVNYPIEELDFIKKVNPETGATTDLDVSTAIIAPDGLSFTHPDLSIGDLVDWDRYYSSELSTPAELSYTVPLANVKDIAKTLTTEDGTWEV